MTFNNNPSHLICIIQPASFYFVYSQVCDSVHVHLRLRLYWSFGHMTATVAKVILAGNYCLIL